MLYDLPELAYSYKKHDIILDSFRKINPRPESNIYFDILELLSTLDVKLKFGNKKCLSIDNFKIGYFMFAEMLRDANSKGLPFKIPFMVHRSTFYALGILYEIASTTYSNDRLGTIFSKTQTSYSKKYKYNADYKYKHIEHIKKYNNIKIDKKIITQFNHLVVYEDEIAFYKLLISIVKEITKHKDGGYENVNINLHTKQKALKLLEHYKSEMYSKYAVDDILSSKLLTVPIPNLHTVSRMVGIVVDSIDKSHSFQDAIKMIVDQVSFYSRFEVCNYSMFSSYDYLEYLLHSK